MTIDDIESSRNSIFLAGNNASEEQQSCYYMPAEWCRHAACLMLYPHNAATFRVPEASKQFLAVANAICREGREDVILFCPCAEQAEIIRQDILSLEGADDENCNDASSTTKQANEKKQHWIRIAVCPSDDSWARDTAPTFVWTRNCEGQENDKFNESVGALVGLDWEFNAYGGPKEGCYWPCNKDQQVSFTMCRELNSVTDPIMPFTRKLRNKKVPLVLEGGSIHTDGEGTILTTEECLLNPNRNPGKQRLEIEQTVLHYTGCSKMIWLPTGLAYDEDTNGHIDNWACFVRPGHVVLAWTDDEENDPENYHRCRASLNVLSTETDAVGRSLVVHKLCLPFPHIVYTQEEVDSLQLQASDSSDKNEEIMELPRQAGERMAASYLNFYISNAAVIVPQYGCPVSDGKALECLSELFPDRRVVGVNSREILLGGGNIHCITQQLPLCREII